MRATRSVLAARMLLIPIAETGDRPEDVLFARLPPCACRGYECTCTPEKCDAAKATKILPAIFPWRASARDSEKLRPKMGITSIQVDIGISCNLLFLLPYMMFAMLMRLVLDGVGLGFGAVLGGERTSAASCTRFTGLCGGR